MNSATGVLYPLWKPKGWKHMEQLKIFAVFRNVQRQNLWEVRPSLEPGVVEAVKAVARRRSVLRRRWTPAAAAVGEHAQAQEDCGKDEESAAHRQHDDEGAGAEGSLLPTCLLLLLHLLLVHDDRVLVEGVRVGGGGAGLGAKLLDVLAQVCCFLLRGLLGRKSQRGHLKKRYHGLWKFAQERFFYIFLLLCIMHIFYLIFPSREFLMY